MGIANFTIRYWRPTLAVFALLVILGINAFVSIPRSVDPYYPIAGVAVAVSLPGASANVIEETVAKPVEEALQGLDNVREIKSTSTDGTAVVSVSFEYGVDAEAALDRVVREVASVRDQLPRSIFRISYRRFRTTEAAAMQLALVGEGASWLRMNKYAQDLREELNRVPEVRQVVLEGAAQSHVRVALDWSKLTQYQLPASTVSNAIAAGGIDLPIGPVTATGRRYNVAVGGAYRNLEEIRALTVRGGNGRILRVGEIAEVLWAESEQLHIARFNGKRAIFIAIKQKDNVNATMVRTHLLESIALIRTGLPPDIKLHIAFDQTRDIELRLAELGRDFLIALALVLLTLLPLGFRSSLIVMISIPLALAMGVLVLSAMDYSLNQISIAGFIISLGLLVDDSIVVVENIERHIRTGASPLEAAISATKEITPAVLGATGVLLFAFLPLAFLPEESGDFVRGLPVAVIATISSSLIVSLTLIPLAASRLLRQHGADDSRLLQFITHSIQHVYAPLLRAALNRPRRWLCGALLLCAGALGLIPVLGFSLFPDAQTPYFLVRVETPEGSSIATADQAVRDVAAILRQENQVVNLMENVGRGNPQIFYNVARREERARYGEIFATLDDWRVDESPAMLERLRRQLAAYPNARVTLVSFANGPQLEAPIAVRVSGPDLTVLKQTSERVADKLRRIPGIRDVENPLSFDRVDLELRIDNAKAGLLGVAPGEPQRAARLAVSGETAGRLRDEEGDNWPILVQMSRVGTPTVSSLEQAYVAASSNRSIPLLQIATPQLKAVPAIINRYKLQRTITITAYNETGFLASGLTAEVEQALAEVRLPPGYHFGIGGESEATTRSFSGLLPIVLLVIFGIFCLLVVEFGRFKETIVVLGVIPLGMFGGVLALLFSGNPLSFLAVIGFIALIGIEIKNSILLVDFASKLNASGMPIRLAIERAGEIRFLPVLLTSLTAVGGLLPLAFSGSALYSPLAWVMIGGLVSSTLLSRVITPVMYLLIVNPRDDTVQRQE